MASGEVLHDSPNLQGFEFRGCEEVGLQSEGSGGLFGLFSVR